MNAGSVGEQAGLVSTIIPVRNRPHMLREAVLSTLAQTYRPIEVIIVDDGSTDETPEVIRALQQEAPAVVRALRKANGGPGTAREAGRRVARGEFIQYLDSDDLLLTTKFEHQVAALVSDRECGIAYGKTHHSGIGEPLRPIPFKRTGERIETLFPALLQSRWWSTSTPLYRRAVTDDVGPWLGLWNEEDWEYEARAAALGCRLCFCDEFVSVTRYHEERLHQGGATDPNKLRDRARAHALIYRHAREAGFDHSVPEMTHFARELFLLCRQCSRLGLTAQGRELFELAREASGPERGVGWDFRLYRLAAGFLGWRGAARLAGIKELIGRRKTA